MFHKMIRIIIVGILFSLFACSPKEQRVASASDDSNGISNSLPRILTVHITTFTDYSLDFAEIKTYNCIYADKENPLLEKELLGDVMESLSFNAVLQYSEKRPGFSVSIYRYIGSKEEFVPPQITYEPVRQNGTSFMQLNYIGGHQIGSSIINSSSNSNVPVVIQAYNKKKTFLKVIINFWKPKIRDIDRDMVWRGEAECELNNPDNARRASGILINELLKGYPKLTNDEKNETVTIN